MPATLEEVRKLIKDSFPDASVDKILERAHSISGEFFWDGFRGMERSERNRLVSERVRNKLGLRGMNVGPLFPRARGERR